MKIKTFFFYLLTALFLCACGSDDDVSQDSPELPTSEHLQEIMQAPFNFLFIGGMRDDIWLYTSASLPSGEVMFISVTVDRNSLPKLPGTGTVTEATINKAKYVLKEGTTNTFIQKDVWRLRDVNYGRYKFQGGTVSVDADGEDCIVHFKFGPVLDDKGVIQHFEMTCRCNGFEDHFF